MKANVEDGYIRIVTHGIDRELSAYIASVLEQDNMKDLFRRAGAKGCIIVNRTEDENQYADVYFSDQHPLFREIKKIHYANKEALAVIVITEAVTSFVVRNGSEHMELN